MITFGELSRVVTQLRGRIRDDEQVTVEALNGGQSFQVLGLEVHDSIKPLEHFSMEYKSRFAILVKVL